MKQINALTMLIILVVLLAACGAEEPTPTLVPTAAPALAPEPTESPTEAATTTPEPTDTPEPTEVPTQVPTATPEPPAAELALDTLANMEYRSEFTESGTAPLVDGEYSEQAAPGSATETKVSLTEHAALGELNGQPAAAVILVTDPGGSGTFYDLAVVVDQGGQPVNVATTSLGDRVKVNSLTIEEGQIVVDMVNQGPDDPMCCPTQQVVNTYELQGDQLVQTSSEVVGTVESAGAESGAEIIGVTWQWQEFQDMADSNNITVPSPEVYTLTLQPDGTAAIQADCNQVSWTYTLEDSSLAFDTLGPSTLAFCGDESMDQQYLALLGATVTYVTEGEQLILNLMMDSGNMVFGPGGGAPAPGSADNETSGEQGEVADELPPDFIQLDLQGLAQSFDWVVVDGSPIPPGPGGQGFPDHIVVGFDGEDPLSVPVTQRRIMYLFPIEAYKNLYEDSGSTSVTAQVERLEELIAQADGRQALPEDWMPLLPPPGSLMDRWVQFSDLNFNDGAGVRYVSDSPFRQSIGVWTNDVMGYYYQGLTDDGQFYVSLSWPVSTSLLPDTVDDAPSEVVDQASASRESYDRYVEELRTSLNALGPGDWSPDLSRLDTMIASLVIGAQ